MKRIGSGSNHVHQPFSLKDKLKRTVALGLTGLALSGPMTGEVRGEQNPVNPPTTTTEKGEMPSQETELVSEEEKRQLRAMIMDFEGVKSEDLPYETIRKLMAENEDRKYGDYRQQLREAGCEDEDRIEICAKWMYAVDNNSAKYGVEVLSDNGFCVWFPYVFNEDTGFGAALLRPSTGVISQNADEASIKKFKDEGLKNGIVGILGVESMGIGHGQMMDSLLDHNAGLYYELSLSGAHLEIVKSLMMGYNGEYLFKKDGDNFYKVIGKNFLGMAGTFARQFGKTLDDPYMIRQLEMMTLGGLSEPLGADNWEFAREAIEGLKK